jgi:hypothetical protein
MRYPMFCIAQTIICLISSLATQVDDTPHPGLFCTALMLSFPSLLLAYVARVGNYIIASRVPLQVLI